MLRSVGSRVVIALACVGCLPASAALAAFAVPVGQVDTFEDGTLQGWEGGAVLTTADGGPGDTYLRVDSDAYHWGTQNHTQWGGNRWQGEDPADYAANDITAIAMDLCNFGPEALDVRILFTPVNSSRHATQSVHLEPGSGWTHVVFGILPSELVRAEGTGSASAVRSEVNRIVIHHDPDAPSGHGGSSNVDAVAGIDNIEALGPRLPGDANLDGRVDIADFVILKNHFGGSALWMQGDFSQDGAVSYSDFDILKANFGARAPDVPEPAAFTLLAVGVVTFGRLRAAR